MFARLDKNEMPRPPPKEVINAAKQCIEKINRYTPQSEVDKLIDLLYDYTTAPQDSIILSSGSDILLKEFIYLFSIKRQIIIADPSFFLISNTAQKTSSPLLKIRLKDPEFKLPLEPLFNEINTPTLIVVDNPNNPTGSLLLNKKDIKTLLENENVILLIDEAYFEFSKTTYSHLIKDYPNLAVLRTLSKSFGLAGSGIGYLVAGEIIKKKFSGLDIMLAYPGVIAAIHALKNRGYMTKFIEEIEQEKKRVINVVSKMGITVYPSFTNFLLMKTGTRDISQKLAEQGIFISNLTNYSLSSKYFRVTIGSKIDNDRFLNTIKEIINMSY
ncbi:MAG: pyridoxal phosphate-dependent aminotransferase [Promethearchaeota archaeon]